MTTNLPVRSAVGGLLCALASALGGPALAEPLGFASQPTVTRKGERSELTFALSQPGDVEIAVLNARGAIVRHWAAGMLGGKKAPPAPLQAGLAQKLTWDGLDDDGKPAAGGPFRFRVRAGMQPKFGRLIGGSPYTGSVVQMPYRAPVNGLAVDAQGNLLVKMMSSVGSHGNSGMWPWHLRRFDRQGEYLTTILPYPPSTEPNQASGLHLLEAGGEFAPANHNSLYPVFSLFGNEIAPRLVGDELLFIRSETRELNFFRLDGSNRLRTAALWPNEKPPLPRWLDIQVAISPDGRYAYYSNVAGAPYDGKAPSDIDPAWPQGRIYRQDLSREGSSAEKFFDITLPNFAEQPYWMPSAWDKKTAAAGIDCDAQGNVLVCDLVGGQLLEIDPQGKLLSATPAPWPDKVLVSRKRKDVLYVISRKVSRGNLPPATLLKIAGRGAAAKVIAELPLEGTIGGAYALDESGETPVLWLAGSVEKHDKLLRIEDRGAALVSTGDAFLNRDPNAITFVGYADVDAEADLVYVTRSGGTVWRFDGKTGAGGPLELQAVDLAVGPGGKVYTWGNSGGYYGPITRYTRDLQPDPLAATGEHTYGELYGRAGRGSSVCGMDVDRLGRVFATYGSNECHVRAYDENGKLVEFPRKHDVETRRGRETVPVAIAGVTGYGGSIRVDRQGNLYLLQTGMPEDHTPPAGWEKDEAYRVAVGTIYKLPPGGGEVLWKGQTLTEVSGAVAAYPGCGPVSRWRADGACACTKPRFDVDDYGRLYIPNGITFSVAVCDNAGNELTRFGGYGNFDCQGPNSREKSPTIPLGWPVTAGASDGHIYVGDCLNHRVVRVDKTFAAEAVVALQAR